MRLKISTNGRNQVEGTRLLDSARGVHMLCLKRTDAKKQWYLNRLQFASNNQWRMLSIRALDAAKIDGKTTFPKLVKFGKITEPDLCPADGPSSILVSR